MLLDSETEKIRVEATYGLNLDQARRITYRVGEGVIGRVVQSGKPVVVPKTSQEPLLLNRLRAT
jgi:Nif-specific regulatory protein